MTAERNPNTEDATLRSFIERLLSPPEPDGQPRSAPPRLYPGRLPDGLPADLPLPDGATVVGGSAQDIGRGLRITELVLDVPQSAEAFREGYRRRLFAAGWREDDELGPGRSGFVPRGLPALFVRAARRSSWLRRRLRGRVPGLPSPFPEFLRLGSDGPRLDVTAADRPDAPTDVRLRVLSGGRGRRFRQDPVWETLPSLLPPPRARGRGDGTHTEILRPPRDARELSGVGGGGWEADGAYSYAALETDLPLEILASHYDAQLEETGWARTGGGLSGPQSWSTWAFTAADGEPWHGTFSALRLSGPATRYLLQVHAGRGAESR